MVLLNLAGITFRIILIVNFCICLLLRKQLDFQILGLHLTKPSEGIEELNWEVTIKYLLL